MMKLFINSFIFLVLLNLAFAASNYRENRDLQFLRDQYGFNAKLSNRLLEKIDATPLKAPEKIVKEKRQPYTCTSTKTGMKACSSVVQYQIPSSLNVKSTDTAIANSLEMYTTDKYNQTCLDAIKCIACAEAFPGCTTLAYQFPCKKICEYYYQECGYDGAASACSTFPETDCIELENCPGAKLSNNSSYLQAQWFLLLGIIVMILL